MVKTAMILPAAGSSRRHPPNKLLLDLDGRTVIERAVGVFLGRTLELILVLGHQQERVRRVIEREFGGAVRIVMNPEYASGMASSLRRGLLAAGEGFDYYAVSLGDKPFIRPGTVDQLLEILGRDRPLILAPEHGGRTGHPVFFRADLRGELLSLEGETGGREVIRRHRDAALLLPVEDEGVILDMDSYLERGGE